MGETREAGRAMDARMAERVMGWRAYAEQRGGHRGAVTWKPGEREVWAGTRNPQPERYEPITGDEAIRLGFFGRGFPHYSADIADTWEVVEWMRERGWTMFALTTEPDGWCAGFARLSDGRAIRADVTAATAPLAICLAALDAVAALPPTTGATHTEQEAAG